MNIYNSEGKLVRLLLNNILKAGAYEVKLNSEGLPSGIYFYAINAGKWREVRKMVLIK